MSNSILESTKKILGIDAAYTVFDHDIITHINSVFSDLNQLGLGPDDGFMIEDATTIWDDYLDGEFNANNIRTYMYLRVRLLFDPPSTSYLINSMHDQAKELEWRLNVRREAELNPLPDPPPVIDGGDIFPIYP